MPGVIERLARNRSVIVANLAFVTALSGGPLLAAAADPVGKIASVQGQVDSRTAGSTQWTPSKQQQPLHGNDRIRTGPQSRAAILYSDQTLQRINEKSEVEVLAPEEGKPGMLRVISGTHYFSSRTPRDYGRIQTPTVTAAIRGTEFVVDVDDNGVTTITMLEGVVDASNDQGSITVIAGEAAYVEPGKAPEKRIVVRPRDAVAWSLYYPRVLGPSDQAHMQSIGPDGRSLAEAASLLSSGQVDRASQLIAEVRRSRPEDPVALALASVIEVTGGRNDEALVLAERAVAADGDSTAAVLALSFAAQAKFDLPLALEAAEKAAGLAPDSAEAQARVAELRMGEGNLKTARQAAEQAVRLDPGSARALTVLGFVELAEYRSARALDTFERAVASDPVYPEARLGLGIATIRRGDLAAGRERMQTAALLDPDNSLIRSYLGKAYYEERRESETTKELTTAKELDPSDPTPWLYSAIQKQTYNRPVEALSDLRTSIRLNDRRAVYRSRLLLDEDLAVRSADLASIYNDLGFEQLGLVTARRSADADQSNYSSHLFLAGNYRSLPGFAPAFLSEVLQARVYQPVNVNAVRPDIINASASFNEYTSLIDRPRVRSYVGLSYGQTDTDLSDLFSCGGDPACLALQDTLELDNSGANRGDVTVTYNRDRFAGSVSYSSFDDDGFRENNDFSNDVFRGFFTYAPTTRDQIQVNYIDGARDSGDFPLRETPVLLNTERFDTDQTNIGVSYRRVLTPKDELVFSAIYNKTDQATEQPAFFTTGTASLEGPQLETQYVRSGHDVTWIAGAGHFQGNQDVSSTDFFGVTTDLSGDDTFSNAYLQVKLRNIGPTEFTFGAGYEMVDSPVGILPPRDSFFGAAEVQYDDTRFSPKLGFSWYATASTVVRAAAFGRLSPALGRLQTLEPTQVAGFNQFYYDVAGTWSENYGIGVDQTFGRNIFAGFSVLRRYLDVPEGSCDTPTAVFGCVAQPITGVDLKTSDDWLGSIYLNGTIGRRAAMSIEYAYEQKDFDSFQINQIAVFEDFVETQRLRPEVRLFHPAGLFFALRGTRYNQDIDQFTDMSSSERSRARSAFWITDVQIGYRLPHRWGSVTLDLLNLADEEFFIYQSALEERVVPARTVLLTARFASN